MSDLKSLKNSVYIATVVFVLLGQIAYLLTVFKDDQAVIASNKSEIISTEQRVARLEERLKLLPETEKELELVTAQKMAMVNTIPSFASGAKEASELSRYISLKDFVNISFESLADQQSTQESDEFIYKRKYELSFTGRYEDIRDFIDYLNRSYQIITIDQFDINNDIQTGEDEKAAVYALHFGEDFNQVVEAKVAITMFTRRSEVSNDEIYEPDFDGRTNQTETFTRVKNAQVSFLTEPKNELTSELQIESDKIATALFTLNIGDLLTSGDTYKFGGPGPDGGGYVGLISQANTQIRLVIRDNGYEMNIEDDKGNVKQTFVDTPITNPVLEIISTMRQVDAIMPHVSVYVYNYTSQMMDVTLTGSLLEQISIFNKSDEQVSKGQTKGSIRVK